jgi:hypothetical protein
MEGVIPNKQRNEIFQALLRAGINTMQFEWTHGTPSGSADWSLLTHVPTGHRLKISRFSPNTKSVSLEIQPAEHSMTESFSNLEWNAAWRIIDQWIELMRHEIIDLWSQSKNSRAILDAAADSNDNRRFTETEQSEIQDQLELIGHAVGELTGLQEENKDQILKELQFLKSEAMSQGRKSWFFTALGVIASIAMGVAGESAGEFFASPSPITWTST